MVGNRSFFSIVHLPIIVANGSSSLVFGTGMVYSSTSPLESILFVPNFPVNLLSVSKSTKDLNYCVTFFPTHCVFQDWWGVCGWWNILFRCPIFCYSSINVISVSSSVALFLGHPFVEKLKKIVSISS